MQAAHERHAAAGSHGPHAVRQELAHLEVGLGIKPAVGPVGDRHDLRHPGRAGLLVRPGPRLLPVAQLVPPGTPRRVSRLTIWLLGFWLLSEGLLAWVWLDAPAMAVATSLAGGIPRSLVVAWLLSRLQGAPAESR